MPIEMPVQRIDQRRQVRLARISRPDEHRQRSQFDPGPDDWAKIRYVQAGMAGWDRHGMGSCCDERQNRR